ncbi:carboxylesterase/lipase family protein [Clostridium felsineum]|uniref:carboxylesterase/lipase family protein n=1 Tax=Clostridium felsineum TaxID=36839 RepID=UPI00098C7C18|nr:carboxylesterase/lipase family protein [Clostridium felsineum]URZ18676.1 Para-nitrobenzyl esterase [Clostridium felsineum DSM 794]
MGVIVETKYGKVEGFEENGINKWFGVPYAKAPVGELRFKRAVESTPWTGICQAKKQGNIPYQFNNLEIKDYESEDCLYMNIWAKAAGKNMPVFVWIYGGSYAFGSCSDPTYDGTNFAKEGVVYVAFNYRLGAFGFYDFTMYDKSFHSNCGLSDQIMALRWIKENIEAFGGDKDNITIAGESAGGAAIINLLASPKTKGLFNKAIAESPSVGCVLSHNTAKLNTDICLEKLGIKANEVYKLKTIEPLDMKKGILIVRDEIVKRYPGMYVQGVVIDDLLPDFPWKLMEKGSAEGVKLIIGTNHNEGTLFVNSGYSMFPKGFKDIEEMLRNNDYIDKLPEIYKLYDKFEGEMSKLQEILKDKAFLVDSIKVAEIQSVKNDTYMYRFDYVPKGAEIGGYGAAHAIEVPIALNTKIEGFLAVFWKGVPENIIEKLKNNINGAWLNFVKTGNPNGNLPVEWKKYDSKNRSTFIFDEINSIENNPAKEVYDFWKDMEFYRNL